MSSPLPDELMALSVISFTVSCNFLQIKADSRRLPFKTENVSATNPSFIPCVSIANCQPEASHYSPREELVVWRWQRLSLKLVCLQFRYGLQSVIPYVRSATTVVMVLSGMFLTIWTNNKCWKWNNINPFYGRSLISAFCFVFLFDHTSRKWPVWML